MNGPAVAVTSFLACGVEMVEALTIVLAVGVSRGWRPALSGAGWALALLVAIVAVARPALVWLAPLPLFKLTLGGVALYFGIAWLRKAILRAAGRKSLHDEAAIYDREVAQLDRSDERAAFAASFNGVFLEGVEVVAIVLALAAGGAVAAQWASGGALVALVLVIALGIALHRPLARVPENAMKFLVGTMLTAFGVFWIGAGAGVAWPGDDLALGALAALTLAASLTAVRALRVRPI